MHSSSKQSIDIGLSVLCQIASPGQTMESKDIADVCNCTPQMINRIERKAKRNFRHVWNNKYNT